MLIGIKSQFSFADDVTKMSLRMECTIMFVLILLVTYARQRVETRGLPSYLYPT